MHSGAQPSAPARNRLPTQPGGWEVPEQERHQCPGQRRREDGQREPAEDGHAEHQAQLGRKCGAAAQAVDAVRDADTLGQRHKARFPDQRSQNAQFHIAQARQGQPGGKAAAGPQQQEHHGTGPRFQQQAGAPAPRHGSSFLF